MGVAGGIAAAGVAAAGIGAVATSSAADTAASAQTDASNRTIAANQQQQGITRGDLLPYNMAGQGALSRLTRITGADGGPVPIMPTVPDIKMDQATLEQTPGYQFNLEQGLRAVQNSAAARGLGVSGAAMKGAATYATGLADSTYQNQFNNAVVNSQNKFQNETTNQTNDYNRLMGVATLGESSAAQTGALGTQVASNIGNSLTGAGNANAAASIASGAAIGNGASGAANSVSQAYLLNSLLKGNGGGGGTSGIYSGNFNSSGP